MKILVLDCESYGIEYLLWSSDDDAVLARGSVSDIGSRTSVLKHQIGAEVVHHLVSDVPNCRSGVRWIVNVLADEKIGVISDLGEIEAVGHRVAHGASKYYGPALIDEKVIEDISNFAELAPRHNPFNLDGIKGARAALPDVPHVAIFDTSYYTSLEPKAYLYGLPYEYYLKYGIRKYGFHGASHRYASQRACFLAGIPFEEAKVISLHLGKGSSVTATLNGKCIDTSMGFSPLMGMVMETRSGDVDPEAIIYIASREEMTLRVLSDLLHRHSGVLALSGCGDFAEVVSRAQAGDERARNALEVFANSARKYIGAFLVELGGIDILVFTAYIAERFPIVRSMICGRLEPFGVKLDEKINSSVVGGESEISEARSKVKVYIVPHNEELVIARRTYSFLKK